MTTKNNTLVSDKVQALIDKLQRTQSDGDHMDVYTVLDVLSNLFDLLARAKLTGEKNALIAIANFIAATADVPWHELDFDVSEAVHKTAEETAKQYGASTDAAPGVVLNALAALTDLLVDGAVVADSDPRAADIFDAVVAEFAEKSTAPVITGAAPVSTGAEQKKDLPAEIYTPKLMQRVFKPEPFSQALASKLQMALVHYTGTQGNTLRALAFEEPNKTETQFLILETGECLAVNKDKLSFAMIDDESYAEVPAALLAFVVAAVAELEMCDLIRSETARAIEAGALGQFTTDICTVNIAADDLKPLLHVIDTASNDGSIGVTGATGPVGAMVRFPVPNVPELFVVLEAQVGATGPYVVARLVDISAGAERVLMRLDQPRHDAAKGLYFFPHAKQAIVLKA